MLTSMNDENGYLEGQMLIATPNVHGSSFKKSVIFMCAHSEEGAMGIIVNHTIDDVSSLDLFDQLSFDTTQESVGIPIHYGGPVETNRGFVIFQHDGKFLDDAMLTVGDIAISGSIKTLQAIAKGEGPDNYVVALGYAGWAPGQLEAEMEENSWISVPADSELLFDQLQPEKWQRAAMIQGVDMMKFSTVAGHA